MSTPMVAVIERRSAVRRLLGSSPCLFLRCCLRHFLLDVLDPHSSRSRHIPELPYLRRRYRGAASTAAGNRQLTTTSGGA